MIFVIEIEMPNRVDCIPHCIPHKKQHQLYNTVYPYPFTVHRLRPRILADFALKVFKNNFVNFLGHF